MGESTRKQSIGLQFAQVMAVESGQDNLRTLLLGETIRAVFALFASRCASAFSNADHARRAIPRSLNRPHIEVIQVLETQWPWDLGVPGLAEGLSAQLDGLLNPHNTGHGW